MHLQIALDRMADKIEAHGIEVDESRLKKVAKMRRASQLLKNYNEDLYIDMAEAELGELVLHDWEFEPVPDQPGYSQLVDKDTPEEKEHNRKVFDRSREISEAEWTELWEILKGQDYGKFENGEGSSWEDQFDGSGIRGWWD
jgi:nitric oxide synthase oxygenase domain/subunit